MREARRLVGDRRRVHGGDLAGAVPRVVPHPIDVEPVGRGGRVDLEADRAALVDADVSGEALDRGAARTSDAPLRLGVARLGVLTQDGVDDGHIARRSLGDLAVGEWQEPGHQGHHHCWPPELPSPNIRPRNNIHDPARLSRSSALVHRIRQRTPSPCVNQSIRLCSQILRYFSLAAFDFQVRLLSALEPSPIQVGPSTMQTEGLAKQPRNPRPQLEPYIVTTIIRSSRPLREAPESHLERCRRPVRSVSTDRVRNVPAHATRSIVGRR